MAGRKFAVTANGLFAMVPPNTSIGDVVCLLYGAETPFLLRRKPCHEEQDVYELVGECYVHGIMQGQALSMGITSTAFVLT